MAWGQRASLSVAGSVLLMGCALSSVAAVPDDDLPPKSLSVPDVVAEALPSVVSVMAHGPIRPVPSQTLPSGSIDVTAVPVHYQCIVSKLHL